VRVRRLLPFLPLLALTSSAPAMTGCWLLTKGTCCRICPPGTEPCGDRCKDFGEPCDAKTRGCACAEGTRKLQASGQPQFPAHDRSLSADSAARSRSR
jgi:hypothetical protein